MLTIRPEDAVHKAQLWRLLALVLDASSLSTNLMFKGGTCASMLGLLDRFSVDLDFDLKAGARRENLRRIFHQIFIKANLILKHESSASLTFLVKYQAPPDSRSTIKLSVFEEIIKSNQYAPQFLAEINRFAVCQTSETMFANKLVAPFDRWQKHRSLAGRDLYDLHYFFSKGMRFSRAVVEERTKMPLDKYLARLTKLIEDKFTQTVINEDLNTLLGVAKFQAMRSLIKPELLQFLHSGLEFESAKS